jgi:ribosomal protein S18 acetylase RimI-like enzyme
MEIRQYEQHDLALVAQLFNDYREFYDQRPDLDLAIRFIADRAKYDDSVILVADEGGGRVVGFCQLYPSFCSVAAAPIYVLYDLFVAADARRLGVAKRLLQAAAARARAEGKARMDLTTAKTNVAAQSLYESLGWVRDEIFFTYNLALA